MSDDSKPPMLAYQDPSASRATVTRFDLAVVILRGIAVFFAVQAIPYVGIAAVAGVGGPGSNLVLAALAILYLVLAVVLWAYAERWAIRLLPQQTPVLGTGNADLDLHSLAFAAVGLLLMGTSLPKVGQWLIAMGMRLRLSAFEQLIGPAIQFVLGAVLFLGSGGVVRLWKRLRSQT